jgi:hypothetical protein
VASAVLSKVGISVPNGDDEAVDHSSVPTTAVPKPTAAAFVQSNPTAVAPSAPAPVPDDERVPAPIGPGEEGGRTVPAQDSSQPTPPANADGPAAAGTPPGNGNAYGTTKAAGSANGNGHGNGHGNGNGNGNASADLPVGASLAPVTAPSNASTFIGVLETIM